MIRRALLLAVLCAGLALGARAEGVRVVSGDRLEVDGQPYRLWGIDAPETGQHCLWPNKVIDCGRIAATALMDLVTGARVRCRERPGAGAGVATCEADGFDIGNNMVHTGWALAVRGASAAYAATERDARAAGRGLWRGAFVVPWEWRAGEPAPPSCIAGRVEAGGVECPAFRAAEGGLYALLGLTGRARAGVPACLCGRPAAASTCMRGQAFVVATMAPPGACR